MSRSSDLVAFEEAQLRRELHREEASNRDYAARCRGARVTDCYKRGPLPSSSFYTTRDYLRYRINREHAKYNPARCSALPGTRHRNR
jgi:hypothetical protein